MIIIAINNNNNKKKKNNNNSNNNVNNNNQNNQNNNKSNRGNQYLSSARNPSTHNTEYCCGGFISSFQHECIIVYSDLTLW